MHIQKRAVGTSVLDGSPEKPSVPIEQKNHKCWRRFMNQRATDRAYIPTTHGRYFVVELNCILIIFIFIEHAANCLTHGVLIIPSFIAAQQLISRANTTEEYWSSIIYGNALILLFSFSTVFHCSCFHPTYR